MAQLVARAVWDREVAGSSPVTPTNKKPAYVKADFLFLILYLLGKFNCASFTDDIDLDSPRILHSTFNFSGDITS